MPPTALKSASSTPMWTSTPPTPPQIPESLFDTISPIHDRGASLGSHVGLASGGRRRRLSQPRPASVSVFPPQTSSSTSPVPRSFLVTRSKTTSHRTMSSSSSSVKKDMKRRKSLPPSLRKPLTPLPPTTALSPISVSLSRTTDSSSHSSLTSSASSSQSACFSPAPPPSASSSSRSRSRSNTRRGLDIRRPGSTDALMTPPSSSRSSDRSKAISPDESLKVKDPREIRSEDGHASSFDTSGSALSFKTAQTSFSSPPSPITPSSTRSIKKVFHLEGSVSECDECEDGEEQGRGRKAARDAATTAEEVKKLKRFHALLELLQTEVGYLMDLRALVKVSVAVQTCCVCLN